jgi:hypothetical protein
MNDIRGGRVTCYLDDIRPLRSFGEGQAYQDFLTLWKDADPDIPIFIAAKAEYAKLQ